MTAAVWPSACVPPDDGTNRPRRVLVALRDGSSHFHAVEEEEEAVKRSRRQQKLRINKGALLGATAAKERG